MIDGVSLILHGWINLRRLWVAARGNCSGGTPS
jgi:hypothetical protein